MSTKCTVSRSAVRLQETRETVSLALAPVACSSAPVEELQRKSRLLLTGDRGSLTFSTCGHLMSIRQSPVGCSLSSYGVVSVAGSPTEDTVWRWAAAAAAVVVLAARVPPAGSGQWTVCVLTELGLRGCTHTLLAEDNAMGATCQNAWTLHGIIKQWHWNVREAIIIISVVKKLKIKSDHISDIKTHGNQAYFIQQSIPYSTNVVFISV